MESITGIHIDSANIRLATTIKQTENQKQSKIAEESSQKKAMRINQNANKKLWDQAENERNQKRWRQIWGDLYTPREEGKYGISGKERGNRGTGHHHLCSSFVVIVFFFFFSFFPSTTTAAAAKTTTSWGIITLRTEQKGLQRKRGEGMEWSNGGLSNYYYYYYCNYYYYYCCYYYWCRSMSLSLYLSIYLSLSVSSCLCVCLSFTLCCDGGDGGCFSCPFGGFGSFLFLFWLTAFLLC